MDDAYMYSFRIYLVCQTHQTILDGGIRIKVVVIGFAPLRSTEKYEFGSLQLFLCLPCFTACLFLCFLRDISGRAKAVIDRAFRCDERFQWSYCLRIPRSEITNLHLPTERAIDSPKPQYNLNLGSNTCLKPHITCLPIFSLNCFTVVGFRNSNILMARLKSARSLKREVISVWILPVIMSQSLDFRRRQSRHKNCSGSRLSCEP